MVIVQATMWPLGGAARSYELLHATISNLGPEPGRGDSYSAHVLTRPNPYLGIDGYEADVEARDHTHASGLTPLLIAVLLGAHYPTDVPGQKIAVPETRTLARVMLQDVAAFEATLKGGRR